MFLRQDPHALAVLTEMASDDLQQYLAGVRYQRDTPVVAALCPILFCVEDHDDSIPSPLRHPPPPSKCKQRYQQSPSQGGITVEGDLEQLNGD